MHPMIYVEDDMAIGDVGEPLSAAHPNLERLADSTFEDRLPELHRETITVLVDR